MVALPAPTDTIAAMIDEAYVRAAREGDGMGIGMSQVIHPCSRALWYGFRWTAESERPTGQRQRIFETGNVYERRLLDMLRMIGADVREIDEATGSQYRVELAHGHLRGKLDAIATRIPTIEVGETAVETKSANAKNFKAIIKGPVRETKPEHHAQLQLYMHAKNLRRGLYMVANKDTDDIHTEVVEYDPDLCTAIVARIEAVVNAAQPPARLHDDPNSKGAIECRWCPARGVCHEGQFARKNCRTCIHVTPEDGPRWVCELHGHARTYDAQQAGCDDHRFISKLVPGVQVDACPQEGWIEYEMNDGTTWRDAGAVNA